MESNLISFLQSLPAVKLSRLYESPYTCQSLFRSLPPLAKQYVARLLFVEASIPAGVVASWALPTAQSKHDVALEKLTRLHILETTLPRPGELCYKLDTAFQQQLRAIVCGSGTGVEEAVKPNVTEAGPSKSDLDTYAQDQWERLLLFCVGSADRPPAMPSELSEAEALDIMQLLISAGLVLKDEATGKPGISESGFHFLLMDTYGQLWLLLREYMTTAERHSSAELAAVTSFLLQLGVHGRQYISLAALPDMERVIAGHAAQLGLLKPFRVGREVWLCPTKLAITMAGGAAGRMAAADDGFIIVETNYRVYAYTMSPLQQSILRLFARCDVLLPNLFVGTITRDSMLAALDSGITADQIITYLRQHAHPKIATRVPVVPGVVSDQIRLWQQELQRLSIHRAVLYSNFESPVLYRKTADFADRIGAQLYRDDDTQQLVARGEAHEQMKAEIKRLKQQLGL